MGLPPVVFDADLRCRIRKIEPEPFAIDAYAVLWSRRWETGTNEPTGDLYLGMAIAGIESGQAIIQDGTHNRAAPSSPRRELYEDGSELGKRRESASEGVVDSSFDLPRSTTPREVAESARRGRNRDRTDSRKVLRTTNLGVMHYDSR